MSESKTYGIISLNKWGNFTNYGSMLQTYALQQALYKLGIDNIVVDYVPNTHLTSDINRPLKKMQDVRFFSKLNCFLSYSAIRKANVKFENFWNEHINHTPITYNSSNMNELSYDGYICGSDTIWCKDEFGFDDGYFANYPAMISKHNIAYSASVGDTPFKAEDIDTLSKLLNNFNAIGVRENTSIELVKQLNKCNVVCTIDPTLLLDSVDYEKLLPKMNVRKKYLLLYSRNHNSEMIKFAEKTAKERNLKIIDISLRRLNFYKHDVRYNTGIEEFLWLVKNAEAVITNSYHGAIFAIQYRKEFSVFIRNQTSLKTEFLMNRIGIVNGLSKNGEIPKMIMPDYEKVWSRIIEERAKSLAFLEKIKEVSHNA